VLRLSDHWRSRGRTACGYGLCLALGAATAGRLASSSGIVFALVLVAATLALLVSARVVLHDPRTVLACATAIAVSDPLAGIVHPGFPLARPCQLVVLGLIVAVAVWWSRPPAVRT